MESPDLNPSQNLRAITKRIVEDLKQATKHAVSGRIGMSVATTVSEG
jgi:hypothetical protein